MDPPSDSPDENNPSIPLTIFNVIPSSTSTIPTYPDHDYDDSDDGSESDDDGARALLGSGTETPSRTRYFTSAHSLWYQIKAIVLETTPSLLFATLGAMFTGELLDQVPHWRAMRTIDELIIIIPVILNLKGNLEMNLSARLGTAANLGQLDNHDIRRSIIVGNLSLLQVQATVVSFVATCVAFLLGLAVPDQVHAPPEYPEATRRSFTRAFYPVYIHARNPIRPHPSGEATVPGLVEFVMVAATSMTAACLASIILGLFMCALVVVCRKYGRDPDNIAPPVASCLGDLLTLCLMGIVSTIYVNFVQTPAVLIIVSLLLLAAGAGWTYVTLQNPYVKPLLKEGWSPLLGAMMICSGAGIVLDVFVSRYMDFGLLSVIVTNVPSGVGSIFVSRLSTALHAAESSLPSMSISKWVGDETQPSSRLVMIILFAVTFPISIAFLAILRGIGWLRVPMVFIVFFVIFLCITVVVSLFIARGLTNLLWSKKLDPDMYALPIHSALIDFVGQLLLVGCFELVAAFGVHVHN